MPPVSRQQCQQRAGARSRSLPHARLAYSGRKSPGRRCTHSQRTPVRAPNEYVGQLVISAARRRPGHLRPLAGRHAARRRRVSVTSSVPHAVGMEARQPVNMPPPKNIWCASMARFSTMSCEEKWSLIDAKRYRGNSGKQLVRTRRRQFYLLCLYVLYEDDITWFR